jgi:acetyl-CoA C-acetyltransferase
MATGHHDCDCLCFPNIATLLHDWEVQAIKGTIERAGIEPSQAEEVYMCNVVSSGVGQSPARQAALGAGCPHSTEATTVNKVCGSGLKAVMLAAQSIQLGHRSIMVAGDMESMSNVSFYFPPRSS